MSDYAKDRMGIVKWGPQYSAIHEDQNRGLTHAAGPGGTGPALWSMRWGPALNTFAVTCADRPPAAEHLELNATGAVHWRAPA